MRRWDGKQYNGLRYNGVQFSNSPTPSTPDTWTANNLLLRQYNDKLVAYWDLDETGTNDRVDEINGLALVATGATSTRTDFKGDTCLQVANSANMYLTTTDFTDINVNGSDSYVMNIWFTLDEITTGSGSAHRSAVIMSYKYRTLFNADDFTLIADNYSTAGYQGGLKETDDSWIGSSEGSYFTTINTWFMATLIADDTSGKVHLYLNGVEIGTPTTWGGTIKAPTNFYIAGYQSNDGNSTNYADGAFTEASMWRNITFADDTEREDFVEALYNTGTGAFYESTNIV